MNGTHLQKLPIPLESSQRTGMPKPILVKLPPTMPHEGEHNDGNNDTVQLGSQHNKRKRQYEKPNQGEDTKPTNTEKTSNKNTCQLLASQ